MSRPSLSPSRMKPKPPPDFIPAGLIREAQFVFEPPPFTEVWSGKPTEAQRAGNRYEAKVHDRFLQLYPETYLPSPWVYFWSQGQPWRYAEPDGIFIDIREGLITIIEIKLAHDSKAWFQLRRLYEPLIRHLFGHRWSYAVIEVCAWYDPSTHFPERHHMLADITRPKIDQFNVHIWNPRFDRYR